MNNLSNEEIVHNDKGCNGYVKHASKPQITLLQLNQNSLEGIKCL